jgi:hypothetical protein
MIRKTEMDLPNSGTLNDFVNTYKSNKSKGLFTGKSNNYFELILKSVKNFDSCMANKTSAIKLPNKAPATTSSKKC